MQHGRGSSNECYLRVGSVVRVGSLCPVRSRGLVRRSVACCTTQCHNQLHKEREADNDRSDREAAASARNSEGVKLASGEVEACR